MNKSSDIGMRRQAAHLSLFDNLRNAIQRLPPASFAMVMATGIVSLAAHGMGLGVIAAALLWLNIGIYAVLLALNVLRAVWFGRQMVDDLRDHLRGPGFLALVAGTCVLGSQLVVIAGYVPAAVALWIVGLATWTALTYAVFIALATKANKPPLEHGITGTWLLFAVAPQSIAVLSVLLAGHEEHRLALNFLALCMWACGGMLYIWLTGLIFYRLTFLKLNAAELSPSYWINMGAMAISTLTGTLLILNAPAAPFLQPLLPFLKGVTLLCWAIGTWWIPVLVALGIWRHAYKRVPLRYDPAYWSIVFPLGMYAASTFQMARAMALPFLEWIPQAFLYIALSAWLVAFGGLFLAIARQFRAPILTAIDDPKNGGST